MIMQSFLLNISITKYYSCCNNEYFSYLTYKLSKIISNINIYLNNKWYWIWKKFDVKFELNNECNFIDHFDIITIYR